MKRPPLVNNGVMFVSTPGNQVLAIDAKTGTQLWRYRNPPPPDVDPAASDQPRRRALRRQGVLRAGEAVLVALDARPARNSGRPTVEDNKHGYYISLAPLVADGKVHRRRVGRRAGRPRIRRGLRCRDRPATVEGLHRARAGRTGQRDLAEGGDQWNTGGGSIWVTGNYDPDDQARVLRHRQRRAVDGRSAARATTCTPRRRSRSTSRPARSRGITNTTRTSRGTGTRCRRRSSWTISATAAWSKA